MWAYIQNRQMRTLVALESGQDHLAAVYSSRNDFELARPGEVHLDYGSREMLSALDRYRK